MQQGPRRFLIASWDGGGNVPPAVNLGARLSALGHAVRIIGWESMRAQVEAAGSEFVSYSSPEPWPEDLVHEDTFPRIREFCGGDRTRDDVYQAAGEFGADVAVIDCNIDAGFHATRLLKVASVALVHLSYYGFTRFAMVRDAGVDVTEMLGSADLVLALQPPGLDPPCPLPPRTVYVGAMLPPALPSPSPEIAELLGTAGDPWVLLSLSTTNQPGRREALADIIPALGQLPVRVLATVSSESLTAGVNVPPNVFVRGRIPHEAVLPQMEAMVCHGGMTSITTALTFGVPLVCVPQGRDQIRNANRVAVLGVGLVTTERTAHRGVAMLLRDDQYKEAAHNLAEASIPLGQGALAAGLVVNVGLDADGKGYRAGM